MGEHMFEEPMEPPPPEGAEPASGTSRPPEPEPEEHAARATDRAAGAGADGTDADPLAPLTAEERFAAERLLDPDSDAAKFVLQFSTGESVTVFGTGLLGRNPLPQPGEFFDHLVPLLDPGKSVSKTHLEFGQESGVFWILDRFSGNGTVVREPDAAPRRCEPGRRYVVARGARVDIGEQFFVVS